jgi:hypothetical protein
MFFFSIFDFTIVAKVFCQKDTFMLREKFSKSENMTFPKVSHNNSQNFKSSPPKKYKSLRRFKL